jgi:hypothetical protein
MSFLIIVLIVVAGYYLYQKMKEPNGNAVSQNRTTAQPIATAQPAQQISSEKCKNLGHSEWDGSNLIRQCPVCGGKLIGYGSYGGYCRKCGHWIDDRGVVTSAREYVPQEETLHILMIYPRVHARVSGQSHFPRMIIMPQSIILAEEGGWHQVIPYQDVLTSTASKGVAQQLTIVLKSDDASAVSVNIDLEGGSYDDQSGEDLYRVKQLIGR